MIMHKPNPQNLPLVLEEPEEVPGKWKIAAQILGFNGWKKGKTRNGAFSLAAQEVGVHVSTLRLWTLDPRFQALVEQTNASLITAAVQGLVKQFNKDSSACKYVLDSLQPKRWNQARRTEMLRHKLQAKLAKEMRFQFQEQIGPCPVPVYHTTDELPDPDSGSRPAGYQEFIQK